MSENRDPHRNRKTGNEPFTVGQQPLGDDLLSFWQWCASDLVSNTMRGVLAEYIVALALGIEHGIRREWDAYDLLFDGRIKIEVKSAAYVQSWYQEKLSTIQFGVAKKRAWDAETNVVAAEPCRTADVYVFAFLAHTDRATINPLDVSQWKFFVLPTTALDTRERSQHSISLRSLEALAGAPDHYGNLRDTVRTAAERHRANIPTTMRPID